MKSLNRIILLLVTIAALAGCGKSGEYSGNGESIYMSGRTSDGRAVESLVDRGSLRDPNMALFCASCHGKDRSGARNPIPDFGPFTAPAITPQALREQTVHRPPYDRGTLSRAITEGIRADGRRLHHPMPRWKLVGKDLDDILDYLLHE